MVVLPPGPKPSAQNPSKMAATTIIAGSDQPDMVFINEMYEEIARHPPAVEARKLLVEQFIGCGWLEAAQDQVKDLKQLAPGDADVKDWSTMFAKKLAPTAAPPPRKAVAPVAQPVKLPADLDVARNDLTQGYKTLQVRAKSLLVDLLHIQKLQKLKGQPGSKNIEELAAIAEGRKVGAQGKTHAPAGVRSVARSMQANSGKAAELAIKDLEHTTNWLREAHGKPSGMDDDTVRDTLVKRVRALESALPDTLKIHAEVALMHVEHELLSKTYINSETMLGDEVKDIPRANFYVTEDGYAWDMEELAQAITSNNGVMRNPLSRQMFTPKDIRGIVQHPQGKQLAALAVEQREMSKGVRAETIDQLEKLAEVLLEDQSTDQLPSRHAIDEFMAHCATLPEAEQKALNSLKCPARDSHTGQAYDFAIGEAVRDAKGNRVCFHKTGDFLKQAAAHLRQNRGTPAASAPDGNCSIM